ncbi:MAG: DUF4442 domain-containing protein [Saprospiraceae bacterium]
MSTKSSFNLQDPAVQKHMKDLKTRWKFVLFFLGKLPSLIWFGIRVKSLEHKACSVNIPFTWRTQNPFRSIYFAAQAAAAELCTGFLVTTAIAGRPKMSMLVTGFEIDFLKKATSLTTFSCEEGLAIIEVIDKAYQTGEGQTITVNVKGIQKSGELVSRARLTWSFKVKS